MKENAVFLQLLMCTSSKSQRKALLETITTSQVQALIEIAHNLLKGNIPISKQRFSQLKRHRTFIRQLGDTTLSIKRQKRLVCRGGSAIVLVLLSLKPTLKELWQS